MAVTANPIKSATGTLNISTTLSATPQTIFGGTANLVITGGTVVVGEDLDVDPFNTYRVLEETRVNTITRETRTLVIPEETRSYRIKRPVFAGSSTRRNS